MRETSSVTASQAKNEFGRVLEKVIQGGVVVITKHDAPKAVLMSLDEFNALSRCRAATVVYLKLAESHATDVAQALLRATFTIL